MPRHDPDTAFLFPAPVPLQTASGRLAALALRKAEARRLKKERERASLARMAGTPLAFGVLLAFAGALVALRAMYLTAGSAYSPLAAQARPLLDASAVLGILAMGVAVFGLARRPPSRPGFPIEDKVTDILAAVLVTCFGALNLVVWDAYRFSADDKTRVATREAELPFMRALPDGTGLVLGSEVSRGYAEQVEALLAANPNVRTIHLMGPGGSSPEATAVARIIRDRGLDTVVRGGCYSACTTMFAAGRQRTFLISREGFKPLLGYHTAAMHTREGAIAVEVESLRREYLSYGLTPAFVDRIVATRHDDIWTPSLDELWAGGAITAVAGPYEHVGLRWIAPDTLMREESLLDLPWLSRLLKAHAPHAHAEMQAWTTRARSMARNERRIDDLRRSAVSRMLAGALAGADDAEVRKAGTYLLSGMARTRMTSSVACARIGGSVDLVAAARAVPSPQGSASDPDDPWGALMRRAFGNVVLEGWPDGLALPDASDPATWAVRHAPLAPRESCGEMVRWYEAATDLSDPDGPSRLRERFARAASVAADGDDPAGVRRDHHEAVAHLREAEARPAR